MYNVNYAINTKIEEALQDPANTKGIAEIFDGLTKDKEGILQDEHVPTPPQVPNMNDKTGGDVDGVIAAFNAMNPDIKL